MLIFDKKAEISCLQFFLFSANMALGVKMENLYNKRIKARKGAKWLKVVWIILCVMLYFWVANLLVLLACQYAEFGFTTKNTRRVYHFLGKVREEPWLVFKAYWMWLKIFFSAESYKWTSFIPWLSPLVFGWFVFVSYVKAKNPFNPLGKKYNHWAEPEEVRKMPIVGGNLMSLGMFGGRRLRLSHTASVFVWGASAQGKTSTVAIPSILESNDASVVAVDTKGDLAKYTSGHRAGLGRVFCFDWNKSEDKDNGVFFARWNPLSEKDMPAKSEERKAYLRRLAEHLLPEKGDAYWLNLSNMAVEAVLSFYVAKFERACANDYLLTQLLENGSFSEEDEGLLLRYYAMMNPKYAEAAVENVKNKTMTAQNYMPVGSWNGISESWQGKELCLPMVTDCLLQKYLETRDTHPDDVWADICTEYKEEAVFFGYGANIVEMFEQILACKRKVRNLLFAELLEPLEIFQKQSIRERTASSDFALKYARGMRDEINGEWQISTVYMTADTKEAAFMTRLMLDMLIERNLEKHRSSARNTLLVVIDDMEMMPRFSSLRRGVAQGKSANMAFLLLTDSLKKLGNAYSKEELEEITASATCKLIFANNNIELSKQFRELAVYGAKSVQLPAEAADRLQKVKNGLNDAYFYRRIADELLKQKNSKDITRGQHVLLVEGFYNLPVKADVKTFEVDAKFNILAAKAPCERLDNDLVQKRNRQDIDVPTIDEVLDGLNKAKTAGYKDDEAEVKSAVEDDASEVEPEEAVVDDEWWMDDKAFELDETKLKNPFEEK